MSRSSRGSSPVQRNGGGGVGLGDMISEGSWIEQVRGRLIEG